MGTGTEDEGMGGEYRHERRRGRGVGMKRMGNKRVPVVAEAKRRLDFLLDMVLKPAALDRYSASIWFVEYKT